ncbi:hypothetical protein NMY22_g3754 [Coprinellus aureogranulatus]|nr:hypothetical protein NMY22_g3754 [Coprinellus aureogranulatus]
MASPTIPTMAPLIDKLNNSNISLLPKMFKLILLSSSLKNEIILTYPSSWTFDDHQGPPALSPAVVDFIAAAADMAPEDVVICWEKVKDIAWALPSEEFSEATTLQLFREFGTKHGFVSNMSLWPPTDICTNSGCTRTDRGRKMQTTHQRAATLYTVAHGPVPVWAVSLECTECHTTYSHDYWEHGGTRAFYSEGSRAVEVSKHKYVDVDLIRSWKAHMQTAWVSSANCANIYLSQYPDCDAEDWPFKASTLDGEEVFDGIILSSLLDDCNGRNAILTVPHGGDQSKRFTEAIKARNARMRMSGLPDIDHICSKCVRVYDDPDKGAVKAVVTDGVTLGADMQPTSLHHPTGKHQGQGSLTCGIPEHKAAEKTHVNRRSATFQLKGRMERARVAHPKNAEAREDVDLATLVEEEGDDEETYKIVDGEAIPTQPDLPTQAEAARQSAIPLPVPPTTATAATLASSPPPPPPPPPSEGPSSTTHNSRKIRAVFGRKRTHNEQILVAPCGIIIARDTFYHAESIPSLAVSALLAFIDSVCFNSHSAQDYVKRTYFGRQKPRQLIYDNNCSLKRHVAGDNWFDDILMPVDVFHFNCKHSLKDAFCQANCNPANFPDLLGEDGKKWYFNTSIAEQTNVWLGGFHSIVREMTADRFDFFLDEMIIMRNKQTMARLRKQKDITIPKYVHL